MQFIKELTVFGYVGKFATGFADVDESSLGVLFAQFRRDG